MAVQRTKDELAELCYQLDISAGREIIVTIPEVGEQLDVLGWIFWGKRYPDACRITVADPLQLEPGRPYAVRAGMVLPTKETCWLDLSLARDGLASAYVYQGNFGPYFRTIAIPGYLG